MSKLLTLSGAQLVEQLGLPLKKAFSGNEAGNLEFRQAVWCWRTRPRPTSSAIQLSLVTPPKLPGVPQVP